MTDKKRELLSIAQTETMLFYQCIHPDILVNDLAAVLRWVEEDPAAVLRCVKIMGHQYGITAYTGSFAEAAHYSYRGTVSALEALVNA